MKCSGLERVPAAGGGTTTTGMHADPAVDGLGGEVAVSV